MVPVLSVLAHAAVLRAFSGPDGFITGWELSSLGIINMLGSCFSCVPLGADFSRSSINSFYGARTRLAGIISGLFVVLYLTRVMAPYYAFVPRAAVASVTLCALVHLVRGITISALQERLQGRMLSGLATFIIGVFFSLEYGVLVGIILDLIICALLSQREPVLAEKLQSSTGTSYILVTPSGEVKLPTVEMFEEAIARNEVLNDESIKYLPVVVDCKHVSLANLDAAHGVHLLLDFFRNKKTAVIFHNLNPDVAKAFSKIFPPDFLHTTSESQLKKLFRAMKIQSQNSTLNVIGCDVESQRQGADTSVGTSC
ncbi:sodium-independent sulfate anion transporter [Anabrus simplex]|uniref:sodium-independent sulfate anion transporter n=1 Tax=Anabrus simplex TaxID=316456 RepID=UPI0035A26DD5